MPSVEQSLASSVPTVGPTHVPSTHSAALTGSKLMVCVWSPAGKSAGLIANTRFGSTTFVSVPPQIEVLDGTMAVSPPEAVPVYTYNESVSPACFV
jgi:hypothetical protein